MAVTPLVVARSVMTRRARPLQLAGGRHALEVRTITQYGELAPHRLDLVRRNGSDPGLPLGPAT